MTHFSVWAPRALSCSLLVNGVTLPMLGMPHGWWHLDIEDASHGTDYQFLLDDDPRPLPDPRSAWQPCGVDGVSRVVDHSLHRWNDSSWSPPPLSSAIIYELHVGTFTPQGTFAGIVEKLPMLRRLGITHVELMPVNSFPGKWGWGYDGVTLFAPQEQYGGPEELKKLVDACHAAGLAILLDVVYNHFGPLGNYTGRFAPYVTDKYHTPWGGAVNFSDEGCKEVRRFFCDNALMWLRDYHFDGLRLDAVHAFVDNSQRHFLSQLSEEVEELSQQLDRRLVLIAESDLNDPRIVTPLATKSPLLEEVEADGGYGIDAQWSDDFHHSVFAFLSGERQHYYRDFGSLAQIAKSLQSAYVYDGIYSENRGHLHGHTNTVRNAHRFLGYLQNHDQVGNRVFGERASAVLGMRKAKLAAAIVLTAPFIPMIFQGEEFAASSPFLYFADHDDPDLARAVSEGFRKEHAHELGSGSLPDPESEESFQKSKLDWAERDHGSHAEMLRWYEALIRLRLSNVDLLDGDFDRLLVNMDDSEKWLTVARSNLRLFFNFSEEPMSFPTPAPCRLLLASDDAVSVESSQVKLPRLSCACVNRLE